MRHHYMMSILLVFGVITTTYGGFQTDIDYYQVLHVRRTAKVSTIRTAYRKLALRLHPDTSGCDTTKQFQILGEAKNVLTNKKERVLFNMLYPGAGQWTEPYNWDLTDCEMKNASVKQKVHRKVKDGLQVLVKSLRGWSLTQVPNITSFVDLYYNILTDYFILGVFLVSSATLWCRDLVGQYISSVSVTFYSLHILTLAFGSRHLFIMENIQQLLFQLFRGPSLKTTVLENSYILHYYVYVVVSGAAVAAIFNQIRSRHVTRIKNVLWAVITISGCLTILGSLLDSELNLDFDVSSLATSGYTLILCGVIYYILNR
ncbi:uncharacterized protein LOC110460927 [Mizuhopecten yessoensis]|uniref:Chaperone protein DnaJ n=1 Tax=Mizuhopecten yessoensis TaxID=6573 RepID=A0A210R326_MIZYE|nr:uncharacterized protein LOC110460927 [Mizuhopecten yessoensis]OWF55387.1 Chaperone protein DnaJ [Mizuhopecten yessoensis]